MRLNIYLRIKQAGAFADAVSAAHDNLTDDQKWQQKLDFANNDLAFAKDNINNLQGELDAANNRYNELQAINTNNINALDRTRQQLRENKRYTKDLEDIYNEDTAKYTALQNHTKDKDPLSYVKELEKEYSRADARGAGRGNTIRRQAEELAALNNRFSTAQENARRALAVKDEQIANQASMLADNETAMGRMRRNAAIGGAVGGGVIGGGLGYGLANWGGKKLGLKGNKALALNIAGTAAGAGLGGYGGYRLGQMI